MNDQQPQQERKPKKKSKKWLWIFSGFILLIIIIASAGEKNGTENKNTNTAPVATKTEAVNTAPENVNQEAESPTNEPIVLENTNQETAPPISEEIVKVTIGRSEIINQFSDFEFNKEDPVDGEENYLGRSSNGLSMIQLIGSGDSVSQISIMNTMGPDSIDQWDTLDSYLRDLKNKLTPNMDPDFPKIELTNDTTNSDGFKVEYAYIDYDSSAPGVFSESYTFTLVE